MNTRLLAIIRKEFIQIRRDVRTLAIIIVMPIMQLFLLGYAATTDVRNIALAVWDQDRTPASRALIAAFQCDGDMIPASSAHGPGNSGKQLCSWIVEFSVV